VLYLSLASPRLASPRWIFVQPVDVSHPTRDCCQVFPDVDDVGSFFAFLAWEVFVYFISNVWAFQSVRHWFEKRFGGCVRPVSERAELPSFLPPPACLFGA